MKLWNKISFATFYWSRYFIEVTIQCRVVQLPENIALLHWIILHFSSACCDFHPERNKTCEDKVEFQWHWYWHTYCYIQCTYYEHLFCVFVIFYSSFLFSPRSNRLQFPNQLLCGERKCVHSSRNQGNVINLEKINKISQIGSIDLQKKNMSPWKLYVWLPRYIFLWICIDFKIIFSKKNWSKKHHRISLTNTTFEGEKIFDVKM